jgi:hypothetical protein
MTDTPVSILQKAADLGLQLGLKMPDTLTVEAAERWPKDFAETLRDYKPRLLALLRLPFYMVYSRPLEENVFFCEDEETKAALVAAGADEWSIFTKAELRVLITQNRIKPFSEEDLCKLYEIKGIFNAQINGNS